MLLVVFSSECSLGPRIQLLESLLNLRVHAQVHQVLLQVLVGDSEVVHEVQGFLDRVFALLDVLEDELEDEFHVVILNLDAAGLSMVSHHLLELSDETLGFLLTHVLT